MKEMTLDTVVKRNENIFTGSIDNETVAMSIQNGKYYQMNETASRILTLLDQERSISELCEIMKGSYRVEASVCRGDVLDFVKRMTEFGLVEMV